MAQHALVRMRRSQPKEPTLRLIAFQLRHHGFCLPLALARRALPQNPDERGADVGLIEVQNEAIPTVNTANLVYGNAMPQLPAQGGAPDSPPPLITRSQSILVVDLSEGGAVGLVVDGTPTIKRVRQSAIKPVPEMYLNIHRMRGISAIVDLNKPTGDEASSPLFLIEVNALLSHV